MFVFKSHVELGLFDLCTLYLGVIDSQYYSTNRMPVGVRCVYLNLADILS